MALTLTQKWLQQNVQAYPHPDRVYADVDASLARFPTLRIKSDAYTYDDGRTQLLLCLHNVIPINFRGAMYNIPVAIWIPRDYPAEPPLVYVVPTSDMLVKAGKHVELNGRVDVEYIQHWRRKNEGCNTSGLVEELQAQFAREPPVYAKPRESVRPPATPTASSSYSTRPPPPVPSSSTSPMPTSPSRPALPPKPGQYASERPPTVSPGPINSPSLPSPAATHAQIETSAQGAYASPQSPYYTPHASHFPRQSISSPLQQQPIPPAPPVAFSPPLPPGHPVQDGTAYINQYQAPAPPAWTRPVAQVNLMDEDSLSEPTAVAQPLPAAAPPRPPNPELLRLHCQVHDKLTSELASLGQAFALDAERLRAQQSDLLLGEPAIRDEMARLEAVRDVCRNVAGRYQMTVDQVERNIAEMRRKGDPEVDELVCSTTIVHNQLISLVAEDNAIEDTIYHLHRALNSGRVDLERFSRTVRVLAEEQFMKRALIEKILVGLPVGSSWA
ncbi:UEV-domain-containing protein [Cylindrobasidium torrendii FP15055 ss-10]|uniref:UEV-domain-containing protein n=1 Tax=Cylindrobasidium torrendii FP15055 ss-10 TaxID=1314674 RepID=A0A0D7B5Z7_9AGAR|nr:UEV-domain-containing protein [Cylindrobasidium torrendii FP15055 ss-10]